MPFLDTGQSFRALQSATPVRMILSTIRSFGRHVHTGSRHLALGVLATAFALAPTTFADGDDVGGAAADASRDAVSAEFSRMNDGANGEDDVDATFHVLMRASSRPDDWVATAAAPFEPAELGLKLRFDACGTTGAYWVFDYGDGTWNANALQCWDDKRYSYAGTYNVTLTIYDELGTVLNTLSKSVTVGNGMSALSYQGRPAAGNFQPIAQTVVGAELWALSNAYQLGVASVANPSALETLNIQPTPGASAPVDLANYAGRLYVADANVGVLIYSAVRNGVQFLGQIPRSELADNCPSRIIVVRDALYVACGATGQIFVYDLANPLAPVRVGILAVGASIQDIGAQGPDCLFVRRGDARISMLDTRLPLSPRFVMSGSQIAAVVLNYPSVSGVCSANLSASASDVTRTLLIDVDVQNGVMVPQVRGILLFGSTHAAMTDTRLWLVDGSMRRISKYDISDRANAYLMETLTIGGDSIRQSFLSDPDGDGPLGPTLYVSYLYGYVAVRP